MKLPKTQIDIRNQNKEFDDMFKRAIHKREEKIKQLIKQEKELRERKKNTLADIRKQLNKFISIPILIGLLAASITYLRFGWDALERILLSWIIGVTIVTTVIALMEKHNKNINL